MLAEGLGVRRIAHENSRFRGRPERTVLNWGSSDLPDTVMRCNVINAPNAVGRATNKRSFFNHLNDYRSTINLPDFTTSHEEAIRRVASGQVMVARTVLQGHSGRGIVLMERDHPENFVEAPLYTNYIKKVDEYRVHVVNNRVIDVQRKALSSEAAARGDANFCVRNHANGFIYARSDVNIPDSAKDMAKEVIRVLGLDFGAVDIIYNRHYNRYYVLEVNTAPGLEGTTLTNYINAFREFV
jgi:glutathione synthase/RimK-type ligase-like ATP-grasp enzyme